YVHVGSCAANPTDFIWKYGGNNVFICGSWNQWQTYIKLNRLKQNPSWKHCNISLQAGQYQYKYVVDGQWRCDYECHVVYDTNGLQNNTLEIVPKQIVHDETDESEEDDQKISIQDQKYWKNIKISTQLKAIDIKLIGSWDNWQKEIAMEKEYNLHSKQYESIAKVKLQPGRYEFKFLCDGYFQHDPEKKYIKNEFGTNNNIIFVEQNTVDYTKFAWKTHQFSHSSWEKVTGYIQGHSMNKVGNYIYIFGGHRGKYLDTMWQMDINTLEIEIVDVKDFVPEERAYHNVVTFGNKLLVYGGLNNHRILEDYLNYNTSTKQWIPIQLRGDQPPQREKNSMSILGKKALIMFGGYYCSSDYEAEFHYNDLYSFNLQNLQWSEIKYEQENLPEGRFSHSSVIRKQKLYIFGGMYRKMSQPAKNFNDVWTIDLQTLNQCKWVNLTENIKGIPPAPRHGHVSLLIQNDMLVFGGRGEHKQLFNDTFVLNLKKKEWFFFIYLVQIQLFFIQNQDKT
ncbi:kelch motif family protein, putative, partial [Ichthyophthirius multifiliis]